MHAFGFLVLALSTTPAFAAASPWTELLPDVRARLITADAREPDGTVLAGLELAMPAGYKTYWKTPGETGIPTVLDFSASSGLAGENVLWPYPSVDDSQGYLDYVYTGNVVLPVALTLARDAADIEMTAMLGICSDICAPANAHFSLPLSLAAADAAQSIRLRQAAADAPLPWAREAVPVGDVVLDEAGKALAVHLSGADIEPASLIAATADPADVFGTPQKSPEPGIFLLPLLGTSGIKGLEGKSVQITFLTAAGPFQVSRRILPAVPPGK